MKPYHWWLLKSRKPAQPVSVISELVVRGQFLGLENGDHWTAIECSDFNLLNLFLDFENIEPVLKQRANCGFNLLRVWTLFDIPGIGTCTSVDYDRIPTFVQLCANYGLRVEFTAYTGINDPTHWDKLCDAALKCKPRPLLELVNELSENTGEPDSEGRVFNLSLFKQPAIPLISAHGSNGSEKQPVTPHWSYAAFHTNDAPEWQRKVGHNAMEIWSGPTLTNENTRYPDRTNSPVWANDAPAGAALLCAGSCFHSVSGKSSSLWSAQEELLAMIWAQGADSVDLNCQGGAYRHAAELEGQTYLRVYQRVLNSGEAFTVYIRK